MSFVAPRIKDEQVSFDGQDLDAALGSQLAMCTRPAYPFGVLLLADGMAASGLAGLQAPGNRAGFVVRTARGNHSHEFCACGRLTVTLKVFADANGKQQPLGSVQPDVES